MKAVKSFKKNYRKEEGDVENFIDYSQRDDEHLFSISSDDCTNGKSFHELLTNGMELLTNGMAPAEMLGLRSFTSTWIFIYSKYLVVCPTWNTAECYIPPVLLNPNNTNNTNNSRNTDNDDPLRKTY